MKVSGLILLLAFTTLLFSAEIIPFGEKAVDAIFKAKRDSVILFVTEENAQARAIFEERAAADQSEFVYTVLDKAQNEDHFTRFAEYLGVKVDSTPQLVVLRQAKKKYLADQDEITAEGIPAFVARVQAGQAKRFLKSAPIPENDDSAVKTLVGDNFEQTVKGDQREYLVKVYAPWCGHCKKIAPEYVAAAQAIKANPNVVLAQFDGSVNQVDTLDYSGFPTLFWFGKDKSVGPIKFDGGRDKAGILDWIKDHSEHEWVEPAGEPAAAEEEL